MTLQEKIKYKKVFAVEQFNNSLKAIEEAARELRGLLEGDFEIRGCWMTLEREFGMLKYYSTMLSTLEGLEE